MYIRLFVLLVVTVLFSCQSSDSTCTLNEDRLEGRVDLTIQRLEPAFFGAETKEEMLSLLRKYPEVTSKALGLDAYPNIDSLAEDLLRLHQDSTMQELNNAVVKEFANLSDIKVELEQAFAYLKSYYPDFKVPNVYTYVSGFGFDLIIDEDVIVIGLDYFLPSDHVFQPDIPRYLASRYERNYLVPMLVLAISSSYNEIDSKDNTLLAEMIYYGKAYHFVKSILPCTSDQYLIGYTPEQIQACWDNEDIIWAHFIENELLFETNPFEIRKYIGEAPATDAVSADAPGRIGRWIGWNIVEEFASNGDRSLVDVMEESDVKKLFKASKYRPRGGD
jgi:gliding motility-associated lipoprotein GldB